MSEPQALQFAVREFLDGYFDGHEPVEKSGCDQCEMLFKLHSALELSARDGFAHHKEAAMPNDEAIENEIQAKGLNAPRLTPELIESVIASVNYLQNVGGLAMDSMQTGHDAFPKASYDSLQCLTLCLLVMRNGYVVVGKSACASPENFDAHLGRKIALEDARRQIWALEGYLLKTRLESGVTDQTTMGQQAAALQGTPPAEPAAPAEATRGDDPD